MPTRRRETSSNGVSSPTANVVEAQYRLSRGGTQRSRARAEVTMMQCSPRAMRPSAAHRAATTESSGAVSFQG